jgi:hypothetical protein
VISATLHRKHFRDYFADSAVFAVDALNTNITNFNDQERRQRFTRSSILSAALCLESAANCCLDFLQLQKPSHDDYEQLKTLSKFDLFLHYLRPDAELDREHNLVRPIRNLLSCRNEYVHSKVALDNIDNAIHILKTWEPLGLPHNLEFWQPLHAVKVFTVTCDFLNHFFFELCGLSLEGFQGRGFAASILTTGISSKGTALPGNVNFSNVTSNEWGLVTPIAHKWDIDLAFLGIYSNGGPENKQILPKRKLGDYSHCDLKLIQFTMKPIFYRTPDGFGYFMTKIDKR